MPVVDLGIQRTDMGTMFDDEVQSFTDSVFDLFSDGGLFGFLIPDQGLKQKADEFSFRVLTTSTVSILLSHKSRRKQGDADLRLFNDNDGDGALDVPFEQVIDASLQGGGRNEFISREIPAGDYIIGVVGPGTKDGQANYSLRVEVQSGPVIFTPIPTIPRIPNGKVAAIEGGLMNGRNTAGTLVGLKGQDIINANNGDDIVLGGDNDDILRGGNGNDIIFGGKGDDTLTGGSDNDLFVIAPRNKNGFDTITDLRIDRDRIGLGGGLTYEDLNFIQQAKATIQNNLDTFE
jgi:Ca2+-binding RTX toxin-like protein